MRLKTPLALILIVFAISSFSCSNDKETRIHAVNGTIDLRGYNFISQGNATLDGEWKFYWKQLLMPAEIPESGVSFYKVPGAWKSSGIDGTTPDGYGTISLHIKKDRTSVPLSLKIPSISSSFRLFVNDRMVCENGVVSDSMETNVPVWLPRVVVIPESEKEDIRLTMQISNFHDRRDGFWGSILIGTSDRINYVRDKSIAFELFLFGSIFIMALYHFCLLLLRRKDRTILYFALLCILLAARVISGGECSLTLFSNVPSIIVYKLLFISFYFIIPVFALYLRSLYPDETWRRLNFISYMLIIPTVILIFLPIRIVIKAVAFYEIMILLFIIYAIISLVRAYLNKREGALTFLFGIAILALTGVNDILFDLGLIWTGLMSPFGLLFLIFSQSFMLSMRYSNAFRTIRIMSKRLMSLDVMKDEFLANTSHELKTPLNGIIGLAESLADGAKGELSESIKKDLAMIAMSGKRLSSLVNDILDFTKLKNSDMPLRLTRVDIKAIIDYILHLTRPLLKNNDIALVNRISEGLPLINADENRLQQVFYNLIGNAVKFTDSGRIEINAEVINNNNRRFMNISISDTGIGIDNSKLDVIFDAFKQGDGGIARKYGGTGIGLSITRQLVELHGGRITVKSESGIGSVFTVSLPFRSAEAAVTDIKSSDVSHLSLENTDDSFENFFDTEITGYPEADLNRIQTLLSPDISENKNFKVLLVDDDPVNLQVLENYLLLENYNVLKTRDGLEAINIIENENIDIVLLDLMMPRITGFDVARKIRETHPHYDLPVIMLTAKNQVQDIVSGISAGANDYLSKPFDKQELLARINNLLTLKETVHESQKLASIEQELNIARGIQFATLPSSVPEFSSLKLTARYIPMQSIGGDFYGFHVISDNKLGILITDVTGHGIPAALIASMLKIVSNILFDYSDDPRVFLSEMNQILTGNMGNQFLTAIYVFIDMEHRVLLHSNTGHEPLLILRRKSGEIVEDNPKGRIMGLSKENNIEMSRIELDGEDRIVLFTDCITEAFNSENQMFGIGSLKQTILNTVYMDGDESADFILKTLSDWTGKDMKFNDDLTLIIADVI